MFRVQLSEYTDHITETGHEMQRLPYPFFVNSSGSVERQDVWHGKPKQVIGFAKDLAVAEIDLLWTDLMKPGVWLGQADGMYLVTADVDGTWGTWPHAVKEVKPL